MIIHNSADLNLWLEAYQLSDLIIPVYIPSLKNRLVYKTQMRFYKLLLYNAIHLYYICYSMGFAIFKSLLRHLHCFTNENIVF